MRTLKQEDSRSTVRLTNGESFGIRLPENPTTGFQWAIHRLEPPVHLSTSRFSPPDEDAPGAGGVREMTFAIEGEGQGRIFLKLWREWEGDDSIEALFELTVDVTSQ